MKTESSGQSMNMSKVEAVCKISSLPCRDEFILDYTNSIYLTQRLRKTIPALKLMTGSATFTMRMTDTTLGF